MTQIKEIFIVEDNKDMQDIYHMIFDDFECPIHMIDDGFKAIEYLIDHIPYLIILDVNLPNITGLDILKHIRQQERFVESKIIIVTSNMPAINSEVATKADLVVTKPIDVLQLKTLAQRLFRS